MFIESQLLTDRQREVKERQQAETAAMFPDLRSSPRPKSRERKDGLPRLSLSSDRTSTGDLIGDGPTTPTLPPPQHGPMDDFIGSSPTPRSSTKELGLESDDIEPPSSPPDFKSIVAAYQPLDPSSSPPSSCVEKDVRVQQANERPEPPAEKMTDDKTAEIELPEYIPTVSEHAQVPASTEDSIIETKTDAIPRIDHHPPSDIGIFIDALSSPVPSSQVEPEGALENDRNDALANIEPNGYEGISSPNTLEEVFMNEGINPQPIINGPLNDAEEAFSSFEDNISRVINSFQDDGKKQSSSDEGQVSSQLGKDLNRAAENNSIHEQGDRESDVTAMVAPQDAKKRKRQTTGAVPSIKKAKTLSPRSNVQVVIEVQRQSTLDVDDDLLDCIVVDGRPAAARANMSPSGAKAEQTPSPLRSVQALASTPVEKRKPGRPRKGASKSALPPPENMTPPRSKKRRASDSPIQHGERGPVSAMTPPVTKKRRSSRLSQTSAPSPSQRDPNCDFLEDDTDATKRSHPLVVVGDAEAAGGENSPMEAGDDRISNSADAEHTRGSILLCTGTETPDASKEDRQGMRDNGAEHDQMIVSTDESAQTDCANRDSVAAGEARQVIGGINSASQQGRGLGEVAIAKGYPHPDADTVKRSEDSAEVHDQSAQTSLTPKPSQAGSANGPGILGGLRRILKDIRQVMLGSQEEREIDDVLFEIRKEVHEAGRRGVS